MTPDRTDSFIIHIRYPIHLKLDHSCNRLFTAVTRLPVVISITDNMNSIIPFTPQALHGYKLQTLYRNLKQSRVHQSHGDKIHTELRHHNTLSQPLLVLIRYKCLLPSSDLSTIGF